jgi:hypothetical protein
VFPALKLNCIEFFKKEKGETQTTNKSEHETRKDKRHMPREEKQRQKQKVK